MELTREMLDAVIMVFFNYMSVDQSDGGPLYECVYLPISPGLPSPWSTSCSSSTGECHFCRLKHFLLGIFGSKEKLEEELTRISNEYWAKVNINLKGEENG